MSIDGRRKLLLIRRDEVEHLVMTGGPVDVVVESGINDRQRASSDQREAAPVVFTRHPRGLGQTGTE